MLSMHEGYTPVLPSCFLVKNKTRFDAHLGQIFEVTWKQGGSTLTP